MVRELAISREWKEIKILRLGQFQGIYRNAIGTKVFLSRKFENVLVNYDNGYDEVKKERWFKNVAKV